MSANILNDAPAIFGAEPLISPQADGDVFFANRNNYIYQCLQDINRRVYANEVSVFEFGAVHDGATFDNEAYQDAIDYVFALGGGRVRAPIGVARFDPAASPVILRTGVTLEGAGREATIIRKDGTTAIFAPASTAYSTLAANRTFDVFIRDLKIDGVDVTNVGQIGLDFTQISLSAIENVSIINCETALRCDNTAYYNKFVNVEMQTFLTGASLDNGSNENSLLGCRLQSSVAGCVGVHMQCGADNGVTHNRVVGCSIEGVGLTSAVLLELNGSAFGMSGIEIHGNRLERGDAASGTAIYIPDGNTQGTVIHDNHVVLWQNFLVSAGTNTYVGPNQVAGTVTNPDPVLTGLHSFAWRPTYQATIGDLAIRVLDTGGVLRSTLSISDDATSILDFDGEQLNLGSGASSPVLLLRRASNTGTASLRLADGGTTTWQVRMNGSSETFEVQNAIDGVTPWSINRSATPTCTASHAIVAGTTITAGTGITCSSGDLTLTSGQITANGSTHNFGDGSTTSPAVRLRRQSNAGTSSLVLVDGSTATWQVRMNGASELFEIQNAVDGVVVFSINRSSTPTCTLSHALVAGTTITAAQGLIVQAGGADITGNVTIQSGGSLTVNSPVDINAAAEIDSIHVIGEHRVDGLLRIDAGIQQSTVLTQGLATTNDNLSLTDLETSSVIFLVADTNGTALSGIVAPASNTRRVFDVWNTATGALAILTLLHDSASSTAANRFLLTNNTSIVIRPNQGFRMMYDPTASRWRVIS